MADIAENEVFTDPATAISHGKRHLLVRDYTMAVTALAQACQLLAEKHGDTADELGEPYLLYGRALLGLAREEAGVLGGGVPGTEEAEEDDDEEEEKLSNVDEKEEDEEDEERADCGEAKEDKKDGKNEAKGSKDEMENVKEESKTMDGKTEGSNEKKTEKTESSEEKEEQTEQKVESKKDQLAAVKKTKVEGNKKTEKELEKKEEKATAGSSKNVTQSNGPSCSTEQNGVAIQNGEDDGENTANEDEEDEVNNLQVAWEVLELAKLVLQKRGQVGSKQLAEAYRLLGEVAMEGGNFQGALNDLHQCMELLQQIEPREPRAIAEIHYQLALAHSLGNEFDSSIEEFNKATALLETRIKELEEMKEPPKTDDSFYTVEGEIKELKELLPEIQEKISDMKDFKEEACKLVIEGIKSKVAGSSNGAGPSGSGESTPKTQKPASDISHLVRKKRKADETDTEIVSPCKKPTPEKNV